MRLRRPYAIAAVLVVSITLGAEASWRYWSHRPRELKELVPVLEAKLPEWVEAWKTFSPGFTVPAFRRVGAGPLAYEIERPYIPDEPAEQLRQPLYVYSPDRTRFIDLFVTMELMKEHEKLVAAFDVDSAVELIDVEGKKRRRLGFCGPGCTFDDAVWLANDVLVVVGAHEDEHCTSAPCGWFPDLFLYDLSRKTTTHYMQVLTRFATPPPVGPWRKLQKQLPDVTLP